MSHVQGSETDTCQQIASILQETRRKILTNQCEVVVNKHDVSSYRQVYVVDVLNQFVEAYFNIRQRIVEYEKNTRTIQEQAYEAGRQAGFEYATTHEFISIQSLRAMSVQELANLLETNSE